MQKKQAPKNKNKRHNVYIRRGRGLDALCIAFLFASIPLAGAQSLAWEKTGNQSFGWVFKGQTASFANTLLVSGAHTNVSIECKNNCAQITEDFVDGSSLSDGEDPVVNFSCDTANPGAFTTQFTATSTEFEAGTAFDLACTVNDYNVAAVNTPAGVWGANSVALVNRAGGVDLVYGFLDGMEIRVRHSANAGQSWSDANTRFVDKRMMDPHVSAFGASDANTWVSYVSHGSVWLRTSTNWDTAIALDTNRVNAVASGAQIFGIDQNVWVAFQAQGNRVFVNRTRGSDVRSLQWAGDEDLGAGYAPGVDVNQQNGDVWVAFENVDGNIQYRRRLASGGGAWDAPTELGAATPGSRPKVLLSSQGVWIVYEKANAAYSKQSFDYGSTWSAETLLIANANRPRLFEDASANMWLAYDWNGTVKFGIIG